MNIIEFNTGRLYAPEGQIIRIARLNARTIVFADMTRLVDGILDDAEAQTPDEIQALVMDCYDHNVYRYPVNEAERLALRELEAIDKAEA